MTLFLAVGLMGYFAGALGHIYYFLSRRARVLWAAVVLVGIGFAAHSVALAARFFQLGTLPVTQPYDFLLVFSWVVALAYGAAQVPLRMAHLGLFMIPVTLLVLAAAFLQPRGRGVQPPPFDSIWLTIHIVMAFLGAAAFVVLFSMGIMYMIQERQLKRKQFGTWFYRLPSLEELDGGSFWVLTLGFPMMTLGLVSGSIWAAYARGSYWSWDLERTLPLVVIWGAYGLLLVCRLLAGWRGRRAALFSVVGFIGVLVSYLWHL
ncbi:MAG: cytochrome c biogenesis protein CcsA [Candidatus Tectomicrobia bacterium]|nr:cytochrome c biogenesis protein CcsA [Candidatus Tectomicrobia bacterium]